MAFSISAGVVSLRQPEPNWGLHTPKAAQTKLIEFAELVRVLQVVLDDIDVVRAC
jgi:hypothetical protein